MPDDSQKPWYETVNEDFAKTDSMLRELDARQKQGVSPMLEQNSAKPDYLDDEYLLLITRELRHKATDEILRQAKKDMQIISNFKASKLSKRAFAKRISMPEITFRRLCKKYGSVRPLTEPERQRVHVANSERRLDLWLKKMSE